MTIDSLLASVPDGPNARDAAAVAVEDLAPDERERLIQEIGPFLGSQQDASAWALLQELVVSIGVDGDDGLSTLRAWLDARDGRVSEERLHRLANRLAWVTRGVRTDGIGSLELSQQGDRFVAYLHLERSRFSFDTEGVSQVLSYCQMDGQDPALLRAFSIFVSMPEATGLSESNKKEIDDIWRQAQREGVGAGVADITLHTLWLAYQLEDQGRHLLEYADRWLRSSIPPTPVLHFRRATALRLVGSYDEAIREAELAMQMTSGSSEFARTFSEQCLRERDLSVAALNIKSAVDAGKREVDEVRGQLEEVERRSITRSIEVVTLFTAAAAFAIGAINVVASTANDPAGALVVLGGFGGGLIAFAALIIASLIFLNERRERQKSLSFRQWTVFFSLLVMLIAIQVGFPLLIVRAGLP